MYLRVWKIHCSGSKLNAKAIAAVRRTPAGQDVKIFDIQVKNPKNPAYNFSKVSPVICELTN